MRWLAASRSSKSGVTGKNDAKGQAPSSSTMPTTSNVASEHHTPASLPQRQQKTVFRALPDDILIFIWELSISEESESGFTPTYDPNVLLKISAVCSHWRCTALSISSLWAYIPSYFSKDLLQLFLTRSANAPLLVDLTCSRFFDDNQHPFSGGDNLLRRSDIFLAKLKTIFLHANRIRYLSLRLEAYAASTIDLELAGANCKIPGLEGLFFHVSSGLSPWAIPDTEFERIMDASLSLFMKFRNPLLRELYIDGLRVPPKIINVASLSTLSLRITEPIKSLRNYLMDVLKDGASLVSLSLDLWCAFISDRDSEPRPDPLHLHHLRQLSLKAPIDQCTLLAKILPIHQLDELHLESRHSFVLWDEVARLLPPSPPGNTVHIEVDEYLIRLEFLEFSERSRNSTRRRYLFTIEARHGQESNNNVLLGILNPLRFPNITNVDLCVSSAFDNSSMRSLLSHFGVLRSLSVRLDRRSHYTFPIEDAVDLDILRSPTSPLKSLQFIIFSNLTVKMPQATSFLFGLHAIAHERIKAGLPPLHLEFENCEGLTEDLLRKCGSKK
ncbi:hypothetical protein SCHPADRAFT_328954 [Schizopora paradoxa]|uniref:F-box domain-containing protein n=1 Tax=Schizopora paradoxa TaxID=27342 RepID=A0A0H2RQ77_9AGAM|nr:hypothetical protein SCHPADRAFT_328954 [Schizopora paradoxa]